MNLGETKNRKDKVNPNRKRRKGKRKDNIKTLRKDLNRISLAFRPETKFKDTQLLFQEIGSTGQTFLLQSMTRGNAQDNRQGNVIRNVSASISLVMFSSANLTLNFMRVMLVKKKTVAGSGLAPSDVLENIGDNWVSINS